MYPLVTKFARLLFLCFLPLLIISSTGKDIMLITPLEVGTHSLNIIAGAENQLLVGNMSFGVNNQLSYKDEQFSILKLCFTGSGVKEAYAMELLISKKNSSNQTVLGHYKVENIDSFLTPFDGVFGAFSSVELGQKAFFASSGAVQITHFDKNRVVGKIDLKFKDNSGKEFSINGAFDAR